MCTTENTHILLNTVPESFCALPARDKGQCTGFFEVSIRWTSARRGFSPARHSKFRPLDAIFSLFAGPDYLSRLNF